MKAKEQEFPRVEVHFKDSEGQARVAVIAAEDHRVKAIFLHGAEAQFVVKQKRKDGRPKEVTRPRGISIPDGVTLLPKDGIHEGPRGVCYVEDGQYKCWDRD